MLMNNWLNMRSLWIISLLLLCECVLLAQDLTMSERLVERVTGPFHLRFVFQPLMAIFFGIKDGRADANLHKPPYIIHTILVKEHRMANLKHGLASITKVLVIGIILDALAQFVIFQNIRILGAIVLGALIIALPYALARGITNRVLTRFSKRN